CYFLSFFFRYYGFEGQPVPHELGGDVLKTVLLFVFCFSPLLCYAQSQEAATHSPSGVRGTVIYKFGSDASRIMPPDESARQLAIMYGPPSNCKRFEEDRKDSPRKCIRPLRGESLSGHLMMMRTCRSL